MTRLQRARERILSRESSICKGPVVGENSLNEPRKIPVTKLNDKWEVI